MSAPAPFSRWHAKVAPACYFGSSYRGLIDFRSRGLKSPSQPTRFASGDICAIVARATYIRGGRSLFAAMLGVNSRGMFFFKKNLVLFGA